MYFRYLVQNIHSECLYSHIYLLYKCSVTSLQESESIAITELVYIEAFIPCTKAHEGCIIEHVRKTQWSKDTPLHINTGSKEGLKMNRM